MCSILEKQGESLKNHRLVYKNGRNALRVFCTLTFLLIALPAFTQVSGIKTICSSGCNYSTITSAVNDINTNGVGAGGVTFNVSAGFTETATGQIIISTTTSSVSNPVIFKKSGSGANPVLTAQTGAGGGTTDGIIKISGADYITFDAIDVAENASNTSSARMDWGYAIVKSSASNGCDYIVIRNCNITLDKANTNSTGIYSGNHPSGATSGYTVTTATGRHTNIYLYGNTISNCYNGIKLNGYTGMNDSNIWIGYNGSGNTITNFGGSSTRVYGIWTEYCTSLNVYNNTVNGGTGTTANISGIHLASGSRNRNVRIHSNNITVFSATDGYNYTYGIIVEAGHGGLAIVELDSNVVQNSRTSAINGGCVAIYINCNPTKVFCHGNQVCGNRSTGGAGVSQIFIGAGDSVYVYNNKVFNNYASGQLMCCIRFGIGSIQCYQNEIYNDTVSGGGDVCVISSANYRAVKESYFNNIIYNIISNGGAIIGITMNTTYSETKYIYGNYFHTFKANSYIHVIKHSISSPVYIYNNRITDIESTGSSSSVRGIDISYNTNCYIFNNMVSDLRSSYNLAGIYLNAGTIRAYFNTVFLTGTCPGTALALYGGPHFLDLRNNILVNLITPTGSGVANVWRMPSIISSSYSDSSDNNCFFAGTTSSVKLLFYNGTHSIQTLADYKSLIGVNRDIFSFSEMPPFLNISTRPYDLHLSSHISTACEGGGARVFSVVSDIDGNLRSTSSPDVGADEGNFTMVPVTWLSFAAQTADKKVHLHWATATEINNSHFAIERSTDGHNFEQVGEVTGAGNSHTPINYTYTDDTPFGTNNILYYRLKQVDFNGEFECSKTIAVSNNKQGNGVTIEAINPNPFTEKLNLTLNNVSEGNVTIEVYDLSGRKHYTQTTLSSGQGTLSIDLSSLANLAKGVYIVNIRNCNDAIQQKLVKLK